MTAASGLRVPAALGDELILRALNESGGEAVAVEESALLGAARDATRTSGVDWSPEGGATLAAARLLSEQGRLASSEQVVVFNTGAGWLYRSPGEVPGGAH